MNITFWGAAREVTGSKHLVAVNQKKLLLDAGFFQGHRQEAEEKNRNLPFAGSEIDAVVLSHAHMDHCGSLPTLFKSGFRGKIYATPATCDVARVMLEDSAEIQVNDANYINRYKPKDQWIEPLYTMDDVKAVLDLFEPVGYKKNFSPIKGVETHFIEAGHIMGSAQVDLVLTEGDIRVRLGFTGDLGRRGLPILKDPEYFDSLDYLISESTYGNREHESLNEVEQRMQEIVLRAVERKGKIIVPAFALGRTQSLIYVLHTLTDKKLIPRIPIFIDSPMATELTDVFMDHQDNFDQELTTFFADEKDPFSFRNLHFTQSVQESKELNRRRGPFIVIATAGMCETGRIRHHLKNSIEGRDNVVLITGFMAQNTLGRKIVEHDSPVVIFDQMYHIKAEVSKINAFSAHAGQAELLDHIKQVHDLQKVFLVHGEESAQEVMADKITQQKQGVVVERPEFGQSFEL